MPGPHRVAVVAHGMGQLLAAVAVVVQVALVVVAAAAQVVTAFLVEDHVVEADAVALRIDVQLADRVRLIPRVAEGLCHGRQGRVHRLMLAEGAVAVRACAGAGHQRPPRRDAGRRGGVGLRETHTVAAELIQRGREDLLVAGGTQQRTGPVIDTDEKDVRGARSAGAVRIVACHSGILPGRGRAGRGPSSITQTRTLDVCIVAV